MDFTEFSGKKILITGHTGFKGSWLSLWLLSKGGEVTGYGLDPKTDKDNFVLAGLQGRMKDYRGDIRDKAKLAEVFAAEKPEIVFHLAAQPLVIKSFSEPAETFEVNIQGTVNVLEEFRKSDTAGMMVVITSDKVYENKECTRGYRESDKLGGSDPYSASKSAVEIVTASYIKCYFNRPGSKRVVTVRAGNVIGGGDWSENRIIPDCIRAIENKEDIVIRNPGSVRPWQYVLEPLGGYLLLAERMLKSDTHVENAWNFGPDQKNAVCVEEIVKLVIEQYGDGRYHVSNGTNGVKESNYLLLDISRALKRLHWQPVLSIRESMNLTVEWYKSYRSGAMYEFCLNQIDYYTKKWNSLNGN